MYYYQIAELNVCVSWENETNRNISYQYHDCIILPRSLAAYHHKEIPAESDLNIRIRELSTLTAVENCKRIQNQAYAESPNQLIMTVYDPYDYHRPGYSIEMSKDYSHIEYIPHIQEYDHHDLQWMMYPYEGRILYKGGFVLHGAALELNGKGFVFTGVSGAGKTTQAHLWQKYRNALVLNGDCPAIRLDDDIPWVYGTPWCGTSGESINRRAHLSAVILVKQGASNSIRELSGTSAFLAVLANVLSSSFDKNTLDLKIHNIEAMLLYIRVFELTCTISEEAVEILEKEIM